MLRPWVKCTAPWLFEERGLYELGVYVPFFHDCWMLLPLFYWDVLFLFWGMLVLNCDVLLLEHTGESFCLVWLYYNKHWFFYTLTSNSWRYLRLFRYWFKIPPSPGVRRPLGFFCPKKHSVIIVLAIDANDSCWPCIVLGFGIKIVTGISFVI